MSESPPIHISDRASADQYVTYVESEEVRWRPFESVTTSSGTGKDARLQIGVVLKQKTLLV